MEMGETTTGSIVCNCGAHNVTTGNYWVCPIHGICRIETHGARTK